LGARRLVTLIGPGGVGKTRLAAKLAETVAERFAGGAWWVELAPVAEPGDIAAAVAGSLGLRDEPFVEAFSGLEALVVLDNCEHVAGAAARWAEAALVACPRLRVVATSREPLDITGEALCHVAPLPLPTALYDDAVVLFADRAAAVRPGFAATPETLGPITEICRRLDGLPLAIELAAARTRSLPVEDLAIRLADRLDLLSGGRGSEPRHRTLRAVVAWTWDLLEGEERRVAQRAAVFPAAFSLEAAERVCVPADDVLKTISALVDKSVLQLIEGAAPRYRMLETIRAYALEQLTAVDEARRTRAAHTAYFRDLAEAAEPALRTGAQLPWIRVLTAERDNLRAAFESALADGDLETALRLAGSLSLWWSIQGEHGEAVRHMRRVLDHGPVQAGPHLDRAVGGYLLNAVLSGQNVTLSPENAVETAPASSPLAVLIEPLAALMSDDVGAGLAAVDRRLPQHVRLEDAWARAMLWLVRAMLNGNGGDPRALRRDLRSAVPEFRQAGERAGLAFALLALADAEASGSGWAASVSLLEESVALLEEVDRAGGHRGGAVLQRLWLAAARAGTGDTDAARVELTELVERGIEGPAARHLMLAHVLLGDLARRDGALEAADAHSRGAQSGADRLAPLPQQSALMEAGRAQLAVARGYTGQARAHLRAAWRHLAAAVPDLPISAGLAVAAAELQLAESAPEDAAELLGAAQALGGPAAPIVPDLERVTGLVRAELSEAAYRSAYERGLARDRQGALEFFRIRLATTPAEGWRSSAEA
jgi:predicted ATPase